MDSPRLNDAVAARVVAWHNRHPLARRIGAAQVHSVGYVVLPFVLPSPAPPAAGGDDGPERLGEGRGAGSLRERALARARQGAELPLPVAAAPAPSAAASAANAMPPGAQPHFDEDFIAPLRPRQVARWARRHGMPLPALQPPAGAPLREVLALPLPTGMQPLQVVLLTAAIQSGTARRRVLLGPAETGAVLGRRVPNRLRAGLLLLLLVVMGGTAVLSPDLDRSGEILVAAAAAFAGPASAPAVAVAEAEPLLAAAPQTPPTVDPDPSQASQTPLLAVPASLASAHQEGTAPDAPRPEAAATVAAASSAALGTAEEPGAVAAAASSPQPAPRATVPPTASTAASGSTAANPATAAAPPAVPGPPDAEPQLGRIELPSLGLPRSRQAKNAARDAWLGELGVPAMPAAATANAAASPAAAALAKAPIQPAPAASQPPPAPPSFAVASRILRTRAEAELVRDAMQGLLSSGRKPGSSENVPVEVLPQGDDFRVVGGPFAARNLAEQARTVLVSRGMRVEVLAF